MLENKFHDFFERRASECGNNLCLTDGETGKSYTFESLNRRVNQACNLLLELGLNTGDKFATFMTNSIEFIVMYLASMKVGTLIVPLAVDMPQMKIERMFNELKIKIAITDKIRFKPLDAIRNRLNSLQEIFTIKYDNKNDLNNALSKMPEDIDNVSVSTLSTPGSLYFSSGTTGTPKGIPQSPKNLLVAAENLAAAYGFGVADTQMGILPNYHTALVTYGFWPGFCVGSNFVLFEKFSRTNFWKNIEKYRVAFVEVVPTIISMIMNPPEDISKYNISSIKFIGSGSAPLSPDLQRRFEDTFGVLIANKYGLSETEPTHFNPPQRELRKEGSIGKPLPMCEVRIVKEDGTLCISNEIGEIIMRGENVVSGYYKDSTATADAFRNGWFYTGDLGYFDKDGFYFLVDRKKDIIKRGGAIVFPNEIDQLLLSHPKVVEATAFGVPDEIYGEILKACIVLKQGSKVTPDELIEYCRQRLEGYKCPSEVYIIKEIPKTHSGKLLRRELKEMFLKGNLNGKN